MKPSARGFPLVLIWNSGNVTLVLMYCRYGQISESWVINRYESREQVVVWPYASLTGCADDSTDGMVERIKACKSFGADMLETNKSGADSTHLEMSL